MRRIILGLAVLAVAIFGVLAWRVHSTAPPAGTTSSQQTTPSFNKQQYSQTDPSSIWVVVDKLRPLKPLNYTPANLVVPNVPLSSPGNANMQVRQVTATALEAMFAAAKKQGLDLMLSSGYRSYSYQVSIYNGYVRSYGQATADTFSARPGYSEHQTGLAADIGPISGKCNIAQCFGQLPEGKWVAANAYKYGFIIRYPQGGTSITGYEYEPWHVRYIGVAAATKMHKEGIQTLEQFFDLPAAPNYKS